MQNLMLYRTGGGAVVACDGQYRPVDQDWSSLVNDARLHDVLRQICETTPADPSLADVVRPPLAPLVDQEVWAAGVTYYRSRAARIEESSQAGGGSCYDRVYEAARPELFLKATPHRVVGPDETMHLRRDSRWIVPEPELVLVVSRDAAIVGYTIGNDLSCRDLEGENPLYLPQAKTFDRCAAVGPGVLVAATPPAPDTAIRLVIRRGEEIVFDDATVLGRLKRSPEELIDYLFRDNRHPHGCLLMTGTGVVPPGDFSLQPADVVEIRIHGIGTLRNVVE